MANIKDLERPHHPFSPSKLQSLEACPCYESTNSANAAAERGTLQHHATETQQDMESLTDEEMAAVYDCLDFIETLKTKMESVRRGAVIQADGDESAVPAVLDLQEVYLPIDECKWTYWDRKAAEFKTFEGTTAGWLDKALISHCRTVAEIVDYKFGRWPVANAEENLQGIAYALGLKKKFPALTRVTVYFKLPHQNHIDHHAFDLEHDYDKLYTRILAVVGRAVECTREDFTRACAVVPVCMFCNRIGKCDRVAEKMLKLSHKYAPLQVPEDVTPSTLRAPGEAALALRCAQVALSWAKGVRQTITDAVLSEQAPMPPGFKIQSSKGNRKVKDVLKFRAMAASYGVPQEVLDAATDITLGPIEADISERAPRGEKKGAVQEFSDRALSAGVVIRGDSFSFLKAIPLP